MTIELARVTTSGDIVTFIVYSDGRQVYYGSDEVAAQNAFDRIVEKLAKDYKKEVLRSVIVE